MTFKKAYYERRVGLCLQTVIQWSQTQTLWVGGTSGQSHQDVPNGTASLTKPPYSSGTQHPAGDSMLCAHFSISLYFSVHSAEMHCCFSIQLHTTAPRYFVQDMLLKAIFEAAATVAKI